MALPFDTLTTTTLQLIRKRLADNVFKASPFSAWLLMKGRVEMEAGGKFIQEPLMYATNQTTMSYRGYDRLDVSPTDELTSAQYAWRQAAVSLGISGTEELENDGEAAVFKMLRAKIKVAEMSLREWFNEKLLAVTSSKDLAKDFLGIDEIIENAAAGSQGTLGGIDRAVNTWWANVYDDKSTVAIGTSTTLLNTYLTSFYHNIKKNHKVALDLILTDQYGFEKYENDNRTLLRLSDTRLLDIGFENLKFKNSVMMWDEDIRDPGNEDHFFYGISTEFMRFVLHKKRNFVMSNFVSPYDQDARVAQILVAGQLTCNNSRFQGVLEVSDN